MLSISNRRCRFVTGILLLFCFSAVALARPFFGTHLENSEDLGKAKIKAGKFAAYGYNGNCFTGGGKDERIIVKLQERFPIENGSVSLFFRLNKSARFDESIVLFDVLGTPRWWDRFTLNVIPRQNSMIDMTFNLSEGNRKRYASRPTKCAAKLSDREWHHIACTWENVNSGRADARVRIYLDGVFLHETKNIELPMDTPAKEIVIGGVSEAARQDVPESFGAVSIDEVSVWSEVLPPSAIGRMAGAKNVSEDFSDESRCPVYRLSGKGPVIDGVFKSGEWKATQTLGPFRDYIGSGTVSEDQTRVNIAYDDSGKMYVGWQAFGTSKPLGSAHEIEAQLWKEGSLELLFSPDGKKIVHFIGNAYSSIYDEISEDGGKTWNRDWNGKWEFKSSTGDGLWSGEISFDPVSMGLSKIKAGDSWVFNACRNAFNPREIATVWNKAHSSFNDPVQMGRIDFFEKGVICNRIQIGETVAGVNGLSLFLADPFKMKTSSLAEFSAFAVDKNDPAKDGYYSAMRLEPGHSPETEFLYSILNSGRHKALLTMGDSENGKASYSRPLYMEVNPPLHVTVSGNACEGGVTAEIDGRYLRGEIASGNLSLFDEAGQKFFDRELSAKRIQSVPFSIKDVTPGDYTLNMVFLTAEGKAVGERNIPLNIPARPTCISAEAGTKNYTKPWGPVSLDGQTVKCWNREYAFDNSLFPVKMISAGADLLSGPVAFKYISANKGSGSIGEARLEVTESSEEKVVFKIKAGDRQIAAAGTVTVEYDGMIVYDLALIPRTKLKMKQLSLEIPLAAEFAKYVLEGSEWGFRPEKNVISGPGFKQQFSFMNGIGVGCPERSLVWLCESDEGWRPYDRKNVVSITRNDRDVRLVFNIMRGADFSKPLRMKCGLICTPIRPIQFKLDRERFYCYWPGGQYYVTDTKHYQAFDLDKAARLGAKTVYLHEHWPKYHGGIEPTSEDSLKRFVEHAHELGIKVLIYRNAMANPGEPSYRYFGDNWLCYPMTGFTKYAGRIRPGIDVAYVRCPNSKEYIDWYVGGCRELMRKYDVDGFYYDFSCGSCKNPKHGCGYISKGGTGTKARKGDTTDIIGVDVVSDSNDYGDRRVTRPLFRHRELWRRMYSMVKEEKGEEGFINAHTDGTANSALAFSFVDTAWHSESSACYRPAGEYPEPYVYRMFCSKEYLGLPGELIFRPTMSRYGSESLKNARGMMSVSLLHREWYRPSSQGHYARFDENDYSEPSRVWKTLAAYGVDDAKWNPYWEKRSVANALQVSPWGEKSVLCSYWQKPSGVLAVISNVSDRELIAEVSLGESSAGLKTVTDIATGEKQDMKQKMNYRLLPHDYKLLRFE